MTEFSPVIKSNMGSKQSLLSSLKEELGLIPEELTSSIKHYMPTFHEKKFHRAFLFAAKAHDGQSRKNGDPYIIHPFETARILTSLHVDEDTIIASLLHDVPEDTAYTMKDIEKNFGKNVAFLVEGITKLSKVHYKNNMAIRQIESLKNLFIHSARDPRVILIKLADRLHNMRTLHFVKKPEKRLRISRETLEIFVPIANLLGIEELKSELEDLCFKYIFPEEYEIISERLRQSRENNKKNRNKTIKFLENEFSQQSIAASIYARLRKFYTIYKRIAGDLNRLHEFDKHIALRIIVRDKDECYKVLGLLHSFFKPKPNKFQDYIAVPKRNGYQSLHTTVFGFDGVAIDFQIRTHHMHLEAEFGIASKYFSDQGTSKKSIIQDDRANWASKIVDIQSTESDNSTEKFMCDLKEDFFKDRIFVFTPKGDLIDLPFDATCIDFAYEIHTEVGHRALKAEVNDVVVPMTSKLKSSDTVQIITSAVPKSPDTSWLDFAKTNLARSRILDYFKKISHEEKLLKGKTLLQKEYDRACLGLIKDMTSKQKKLIIDGVKKYHTYEEVLVGIGEGAIRPLEVVNIIFPNIDVPGSGIKSFLKRIYHSFQDRNYTSASIKIVSIDAVGQLKKILAVLADLELSSLKTVAYISYKKDLICKLVVSVSNYSQVSALFENLEHIEGVKRVERLSLTRNAFFFFGLIATFLVWAAHPYILLLISKNLQGFDRIYSEILQYVGLFFLFFLVYLLNFLTQRSFPELRKNRIFWALTLFLSIFAIVTVFAEIYFYDLGSNWAILMGLILLFMIYITTQYVIFLENHGRRNC